MKIEIKYDKERNLGGHNNISVNIPEINLYEKCDSFYFALDNSFMPNDESSNKVILSLIENLRYWIKSIMEIQKNTTIYLPFDLSDDYVGFLVLNKNINDLLTISYGISQELGGYGVNAYMPIKFEVNNPRITSNELVVSKEEFVNDIQLSIKKLENQLD